MLRQMILMATIALLTVSLASAEIVEVSKTSANKEALSVTVLESNPTQTVVRFDISAFGKEPIEISYRQYYTISLAGATPGRDAGYPELPMVNRSIIIPDDADVRLNVISSSYVDIPGLPVAPSKGPVPISANPDEIPYKFGDVYQQAEWYPADLATLSEPFIFREYRGTTIALNAFRYLPSSQTLRIYTSVTLEIVSVGSKGGLTARNGLRPRPAPEFTSMYKRIFLNYPPTWAAALARVSAAAAIDEGAAPEMLVIAYDDFADEMAPLIEWKNQKGIKTTLKSLSEIGSDTTAIKAYIDDYYAAPGTNLVYVLLVGDAAQVPSFDIPSGYYQAPLRAPSDYMYALMDSDIYPDIIVGRFSAESAADVSTQVDRSIAYEKNPQGSGWFRKGSGISGGMFISHMDTVRNLLLASVPPNGPYSTYDSIDQIYAPGDSLCGKDIYTPLNEGRSIVANAGHGFPSEWYCPYFGVANIRILQNQGKLPFIFSISCLTGNFQGNYCFGEAWLRARDAQGAPIGAVGTYMSSVIQYTGVVEPAQYGFCQALTNGDRSSFGGLCYAGITTMLAMFNGIGTSVQMARGWVLFGDPSLQVRTDNPVSLTATHAGAMQDTASFYNVEVAKAADGSPAVGARCALCQEGVLYGSALTDIDGHAMIPITGPIYTGGPLTLTVTGFNTRTIQENVVVNYDLFVHLIPYPSPTRNCSTYVLESRGYKVTCRVLPDTALKQGFPCLKYEVNNNGTWTRKDMTGTGNPNEYSGWIDLQAAGDDINYFVAAEDTHGHVFNTPIYSIHVIDYLLAVQLDDSSTKLNVFAHPVEFSLTVKNDGTLTDSYDLSISSAKGWSASILNMQGQQIQFTEPVAPDGDYSFKGRVIIGSATPGEQDQIHISVVSRNSSHDPKPAASIDVQAVSDGPLLALPVVETFPTESLNVATWVDNSTLQISNTALYAGHGSPPYSVLYDAEEAQPLSPNVLTSHRIGLGEQSYAHVQFWYERTGSGDSPEPGDDLIAEYLSRDGRTWNNLATIPGDGPDMTDFAASGYCRVPEDGLSDLFRIRFSAKSINGNGDSLMGPWDTWFVDDVSVLHNGLMITAVPLGNTRYCQQSHPDGQTGYPVNCLVFHDFGFAAGFPCLLYQVNTGDWQASEMLPTGEPYTFASSIPYQQPGDEISYKIVAVDTHEPKDSCATESYTFHVLPHGLTLALIGGDAKSEYYSRKVEFPFTIKNGCVADTFALNSTSSHGWTVRRLDEDGDPIPLVVPLSPGQIFSFHTEVTVGSMIPNFIDYVRVSATSSSPDHLTDSKTVTVISAGRLAPFPFVDVFPQLPFAGDKWKSYDPYVEITDATGTGPSSAYSVRLSCSSLSLRKMPVPCDTVTQMLTSNPIDLSAVEGDVIVSFAYKAGNQTPALDPPESSDHLILEYLDSIGGWCELVNLAGSGTAMSNFSEISNIPVPSAQKHDHFQIRFRAVSNADDGDPSSDRDNWFIDNVTVSGPNPSSPPALCSPPNGTVSTISQPKLSWRRQALAYYWAEIDNNADFSSPYGSAFRMDTAWVVTPALSNGLYYWAVRSSADSVHWIARDVVWTYTKYTRPPSCPTLYVLSDLGYEIENNLLAASEDTAQTAVTLTDYYLLQHEPAIGDDGYVYLQLREDEQQTTTFDRIQLSVAWVDEGREVGVSDKGTVFYPVAIAVPVTAVDGYGIDHTSQLTALNGNPFESERPDKLTISFGKVVTSGIGAFGVKGSICGLGLPPPAKVCNWIQPDADSRAGNILRIQVKDRSGAWTMAGVTAPRKFAGVMEYVDLTRWVTPDEDLCIQLRWDQSYQLDHLAYYRFDMSGIAGERLPLAKAGHSALGDILDALTVDEIHNALTLRPGESISLSFGPVPKPPADKVAKYVLTCAGRYRSEESSSATTDSSVENNSLAQNSPNPFNEGTLVRYSLRRDGQVRLEIFDLLGRRVRALVDGFQSMGGHEVRWDARDSHGQPVASGIYFYRITTEGFSQSKKMILVK